jgi:hypothetical protein
MFLSLASFFCSFYSQHFFEFHQFSIGTTDSCLKALTTVWGFSVKESWPRPKNMMTINFKLYLNLSQPSYLKIWASKIYSLEANIKTLNGHNFFILKYIYVISSLLSTHVTPFEIFYFIFMLEWPFQGQKYDLRFWPPKKVWRSWFTVLA